MKLTDRLKAAYRGFKFGAGLGPSVLTWGVSPADYAPAEYGNYLATSNNVYAVVTQRAAMLASLPGKVYQQNARGERKEVTAGDLYDLLHHVNPFWTFRRLIEMTELSSCLWGAWYWCLERGKSGTQTPQEIWWARPDRMRVIPHATDYLAGFIYDVPTGQQIHFGTQEVIWAPRSNPLDEFSGLSPMAAARLAADVASAAMQSNRNLFANGLQMGGLLVPAKGERFTPEQADDLGMMLDKRFKGVDKAHRWGVLRFEAQIQNPGVTPKDAEFLGALNWSLAEICRAYHWPIDLVGGQRTYENVNAAHKAAWTHCLLPEAAFIASEITEKLLPMFGSGLEFEFDASEIAVLHEDETAKWQRNFQQITVGAITVNEWRAEQGLAPVAWGDVPKGASEPAQPIVEEEPAIEEPQRAQKRGADEWDYGGPSHRLAMAQFDRSASRAEKKLSAAVQGVFKAQQESILSKPIEPDEPFDMREWVKRMRDKVKPVIREIVEGAGEAALVGLGIALDFDIDNPNVKRFIEGRAQRFAQRVEDTTWQHLKESLTEGVEAGDGIPELEERVRGVMGDRIRSTPETIARTEVIGALNGGTLESWRQSDVVSGKVWLSAMDDRVREDHENAHGQTVGLNEDFTVGGASGPGPGMMGEAEQDINCRCTMKAEIKEGWE